MSQEKPKMQIEVPSPGWWRTVKYTKGLPMAATMQITSHNSEFVPLSGAVSAEAIHRNDETDVLGLGWVLRKRRTPYYPAKLERKKGKKGEIMEKTGALFFDDKTQEGRKHANDISDEHIKAGHMVVTFLEGTSQVTGPEIKETYDGGTRLAINNDLDEIILIGIGGTDTPPIFTKQGERTRHRERPERVHIEFGRVSLTDFLEPYRQAEKKPPIVAKRAFHNDVVIPSLQEIVYIAYDRAAS